MKHQLNVQIKSLVSDQGGKYTSHEFKKYLKKQGIVQQLTVQYTWVQWHRQKIKLDSSWKNPCNVDSI
jgi:hypothetical protein